MMNDNKARSFVPLPMNPLHIYLDNNNGQIENTLTKLSHGITQKSTTPPESFHPPSSSRIKNLYSSQSNPTSDFTIIEIIKPDRQKHSSDFIPAFAKPYVIQDSSLESAITMNLESLKAHYIQRDRKTFSITTDLSSALPSSLPKPSQSVSSYQLSQPSPAIFSFPSGHGKVKVGFNLSQLDLTCQQFSTDDSNPSSETQSVSSDDRKTPNSPFLPSSITQSSKLRISTQGCQLTKEEVVSWVNKLRQYLSFWGTGRMSSAHADELYQLLCAIEDKMAHSFLTPQVLGETNLGKVMKLFRHGGHDAKSKEVARRVTRYWRQVCLEA